MQGGLWADLNAANPKIIGNHVYRNWDEGIFIEISSGAVVTGNTVSGNGLKNDNGSGSGCPWLWGGGITLASSDRAEVAHNKLSGNCNGITGTQQTRKDGKPGLLANVNIHDNLIVGPGGKTGVAADNGANLTTRSLVFANNAFDDTTSAASGTAAATDKGRSQPNASGSRSQTTSAARIRAAGRSSPARMRAMASRFSAPETATTTSGERAIARNVNVRRGCG